MKIRIPLPDECINGPGNKHALATFIDDILLWGMELEIDVSLYSTHVTNAYATGKYVRATGYAVFTVEEQSTMIFALRWGAVLHKKSKKLEIA